MIFPIGNINTPLLNILKNIPEREKNQNFQIKVL